MKDHSIFFPLALIAAGALWILIGTDRVPSANLWALAHIWPFMLIAAGIGLILRSYWAPARPLTDLLVVGAAVLTILYAPQLGWTSPQWSFGFGDSFTGSIPGSGKLITETRQVEGIQSISIPYPAEVTIQQGAAESITIQAEDNLVPQLTTKVENGNLVIKNGVTDWSKRVSARLPVRITIVVKDLREVNLSGAGSVKIGALKTQALSLNISGAGSISLEQLDTPRLDCHLSGAGNINASGTAADLQIVISGVGSFDGAKLISKSANARISGAGSATLHPSDDLNAEISGTGSIRYYGSPNIRQHVSGVGSVRKAGE